MNQADRMSYPVAEAIGEALAAAWQRVRSALAAYTEARARAEAIRQLERLSDHLLNDIGIQRGEIRSRVRDAEMPWS